MTMQFVGFMHIVSHQLWHLMARFHIVIAIAIAMSLHLVPLVSMILFPLSDCDCNSNIAIAKY